MICQLDRIVEFLDKFYIMTTIVSNYCCFVDTSMYMSLQYLMGKYGTGIYKERILSISGLVSRLSHTCNVDTPSKLRESEVALEQKAQEWDHSYTI